VWQPLTGWLGHAAPFEFSAEYRPAAGIQQYQCGTPAVLAMTALDTALDVFDAAHKLGGMGALRAKSLALTDAFMDEIEARVPTARIATPRDATLRGSQVSISLPEDIDGYAVMQALIHRGVIGDFRAGEPALLRFGFTPLYTRFVDVVDAVGILVDILTTESWRKPEFMQRQAVT
jgi:kynureninase